MNFSDANKISGEFEINNEDREIPNKEDDGERRQLEILMAVVPIVVPVLFSIIIIIGFFGNLLVILVVILNKTMRNTTNILIFNLAVSK